MLDLHRPDPAWLRERLAEWATAPLSYTHRSGIDHPPQGGFIVDHHRAYLGRGQAVFSATKAALDEWVHFPDWAVIHPHLASQTPGSLVAMVVRIMGLWWINPCRILQRHDSETTHGFVYGTLPEHAECGEELFGAEMDAQGDVWYVIRAFSRPRHWMAWVGFPLARWWQCRFVRDSQAKMQHTVRAAVGLQ
ncbi:MAG: DUF1990 domain-containing protein [Verrucomicrobiaceae bacterium]|nr:DUF1990 domain-containing protein [Verrucomicrobiaceae bacterium]